MEKSGNDSGQVDAVLYKELFVAYLHDEAKILSNLSMLISDLEFIEKTYVNKNLDEIITKLKKSIIEMQLCHHRFSQLTFLHRDGKFVHKEWESIQNLIYEAIKSVKSKHASKIESNRCYFHFKNSH